MPESVTLNNELEIIEIRSFGIVINDDLETSKEAVLRIYEEQGYTRVLVDTSEQETLPGTIDILDFISALPRSIKFAVLTGESHRTVQDQHFAETVAVNRCINVRNFDSIKKALEWLEV